MCAYLLLLLVLVLVAAAVVGAQMAGKENVLLNLAGHEHLVAIAVGFALDGLASYAWRRLPGFYRRGGRDV